MCESVIDRMREMRRKNQCENELQEMRALQEMKKCVQGGKR